MKKLQIILLIAAGISSFAAAFGTSWYLNKKKAALLAQKAQAAPPAQAAGVASAAEAVPPLDFSSGSETASMGMSERQLQNLIHDVRTKLKDYQQRELQLEQEAARIEMSRQALQQDIDRLNALRDKLNVSISEIQQKETELQQSVMEIAALEKTNFQRLAGTYEKMEVVQAGKIMVTMAASNQLQDAVKIIYYMTDRSAGKLLAEIATAKPELASIICAHLKRIKESE